jgi:hypothetical protein
VNFPTAIPVMTDSAIGISRTRAGPNSRRTAGGAVVAMQNTRSSRRISPLIASSIAPAYVSSLT